MMSKYQSLRLIFTEAQINIFGKMVTLLPSLDFHQDFNDEIASTSSKTIISWLFSNSIKYFRDTLYIHSRQLGRLVSWHSRQEAKTSVSVFIAEANHNSKYHHGPKFCRQTDLGKQCKPRSDCSWWGSVIRVYTVLRLQSDQGLYCSQTAVWSGSTLFSDCSLIRVYTVLRLLSDQGLHCSQTAV